MLLLSPRDGASMRPIVETAVILVRASLSVSRHAVSAFLPCIAVARRPREAGLIAISSGRPRSGLPPTALGLGRPASFGRNATVVVAALAVAGARRGEAAQRPEAALPINRYGTDTLRPGGPSVGTLTVSNSMALRVDGIAVVVSEHVLVQVLPVEVVAENGDEL